MARIAKLLALVCSSGFSVGVLVTSVVIVGSWSNMEPASAIVWFAQYGLTLGMVMAPLGALAVVFSLVGLVFVVRSGDTLAQRVLWSVAFLSALGAMLLLAVYFGEANTRFFENTIEPPQVAEEIADWAFWNWVRTTLSILATLMMLIALAIEGEDADVR